MVSRDWPLTLLVVLFVFLGPVFTITEANDTVITVFNVSVPFLVLFLLLRRRYVIAAPAVSYFVGWVAVVVLLALLSVVKPGAVTVISHLMALLAGVSLVLLVKRSGDLLWALVLSSLPVIAADIAAWLGIIPRGNTASLVIPASSYGGIGVSASYGMHGIIVAGGVVAAASLLLSGRLSTVQRYTAASCIAFGLPMIAFSQSRSSYLAVAVGLSIVGVALLDSRKQFAAVGGLGGIGAIGVPLLVQLRPKTAFARFEQLYTVLAILREYPLTGVGWNQFYPVYSPHVLHFTPANYFVGGGIVAGLLYLVLLVYPVRVMAGRFLTGGVGVANAGVFALYMVIVVEIFLFKSTPSAQLIAIGGVLCNLPALEETVGS